MAGKKKGKKKKKSWKSYVKKGLQITAATVPEWRTAIDGLMYGGWERSHIRWIYHRTGYNIESKEWDIMEPITNYVIIPGAMGIGWKITNALFK